MTESVAIDCSYCGQVHEGTYHHESQYGQGPIYESICGEYSVFHTREVASCLACVEHPGWAHGDESRRRQPADVCRSCLGSGRPAAPVDPAALVVAWADVQGEALYRLIVTTRQGKPKMGRCLS